MGYPAEKIDKKWSYADYYSWDDSKRYELIDGEVYDMSPAPSTNHQRISGRLFVTLEKFFSVTDCDVFYAPFDVRFSDFDSLKDTEIYTVLQPDIVVICDKTKIDEKGCKGSPDLVIEVLSPYTLEKDFRTKFNIYELYGVKEYWIVDPMSYFVYLYCLKNKKFDKQKLYTKNDVLKSQLFSDLEIDLNEVFSE